MYNFVLNDITTTSSSSINHGHRRYVHHVYHGFELLANGTHVFDVVSLNVAKNVCAHNLVAHVLEHGAE